MLESTRFNSRFAPTQKKLLSREMKEILPARWYALVHSFCGIVMTPRLSAA
jgi:hypothetical protein